MSNESEVARAVTEKLKHYLEVQRREEAFDLSTSNRPLQEPPLIKPRNKHGRYGVSSNPIRRRRSSSRGKEIKKEIRRMHKGEALSPRERGSRLAMERRMSKRSFTPDGLSPYALPVMKPKNSSKITDQYIYGTKKGMRIRPFSGKVGQSPPILRRSPPQKITNIERDRIVNMTTKLLVATETIALPKDRKQSRKSQTGQTEPIENVNLPQLFMDHSRPKSAVSAFSDPGPPGKKKLQRQSQSRARSAEQRKDMLPSSTDEDVSFIPTSVHQLPKLNSYFDSPNFSRTSSPGMNNRSTNYSPELNNHSRTSSPITRSMATSPALSSESASFTCDNKVDRTSSPSGTQVKETGYENDDFEFDSSAMPTPYSTPRTCWTKVPQKTTTSTQTTSSKSTQTHKSSQPDSSFQEKVIYPSKRSFSKQASQTDANDAEEVIEVDSGISVQTIQQLETDNPDMEMYTQTRREDLEPKMMAYEVYVVTGDKLGSGTKADVKVNIFGEYGDTGDRPLVKSSTNTVPFQRSQVDVFYLDSIFLGNLLRLRIGHNGTALGMGWFLEKLVVKEGASATRAFEFVCSRWLSSKEDDGQIVRELLLTKQIQAAEVPKPKATSAPFMYRRLSLLSSDDSSAKQLPIRASSAPARRGKIISKPNQVEEKEAKREREYFDRNEKFDPKTVVRPVDDGRESPRHKVTSSSKTKESSATAPNKDAVKKQPRAWRASKQTSPSSSSSSSSDSEEERKKRKMEKKKRRERKHKRDDASPKHGPTQSGNDQGSKVPQRNKDPLDNIGNEALSNTDKERHKKDIIDNKESSNCDVKSTKTTNNKPSENLVTEDDIIKNKFGQSVSNSPTHTAKSSGSGKSSPLLNDEEESVEFSNKDMTKRYEENSGKDDLYMAGFIAGIKSNREKEDSQQEKERQAFEEKLHKGPTIHQACEDGNFDRVKELVGAMPDLASKVDERGWAPLHITAAFGHLDIVKWLSVQGVDLGGVTPTGYTAIHLAAMNGHVNCIMILSAMGCPISCRTVDDFTPLHLASMSGHLECVKWLVSNRANLNVKDNRGRSPLDLAQEFGHEECVQILSVMTRELQRKDSAIAILRRRSDEQLSVQVNKLNIEDGVSGKGGDSGVGGSNDEEWVSDAEDTCGVVGRGGDDRSEMARKNSMRLGRRNSDLTRQNSLDSIPNIRGRPLSRQDSRQKEEMEEKKRLYDTERRKLQRRNSSFLDSIRMDVDGGIDEEF